MILEGYNIETKYTRINSIGGEHEETFQKILPCLLLMVLMVVTMSVSVQAAVKLNQTKASLYPGKTVTLKVTGTNKKAKWTSSNSKVAKEKFKRKSNCI